MGNTAHLLGLEWNQRTLSINQPECPSEHISSFGQHYLLVLY